MSPAYSTNRLYLFGVISVLKVKFSTKYFSASIFNIFILTYSYVPDVLSFQV